MVSPSGCDERRPSPLLANPWRVVVLLVLAALPYLGILRNDFAYNYDDKSLILDSPYVHNFQHLREVLTTTLFSHLGVAGGTPYYRPVATLGFLLCYRIFGPLAFGFHLFSLLLHVGVVAVLFLCAEELLEDRTAALVAAGLFAFHPVHVESVAWISAVTDIELTLFYLLTFWFFLRLPGVGGVRKIWTEIAMVGSFILAILAKEQAVTLPFLAVVYEHFYRADRSQTKPAQKALRYAPLWLVCVGYALLRIRLMGAFTSPTGMHKLGGVETILTGLALIGRYLGKLLWPAHLSAFYPFSASTSPLDLYVLGGAAGLMFSVGLWSVLWKRARPASFGILWLFVTLAPVLNVRWMSAYAFADRYLYLPSVGFCLVGGWAGAAIWQMASERNRVWRGAVVGLAGVVVVVGALRITHRVPDWRDDVVLFTQTLAEDPDDPRLHDALGLAYWIRGEARGAEREWKDTLRLDPNSTQTLDSLGALYASQRRYDQALPLMEQALRLNPQDANAHLNMGAAYAETGRMDLAEEQFRAAVLLTPMNFNAHNLLGKLYFDSKRFNEAEEQFRQSLRCEPNLAAYDYLGYIYVQWGARDRAEQAFRGALAMNHTDSHAHFNLGLIYAASGRHAQALEELQAALAADPRNSEIKSALEMLNH